MPKHTIEKKEKVFSSHAEAGLTSDLTHGLLAHSALVGVPGRLVMMRVWDEASTNTEKSEGFNLQVGGVSGKTMKIDAV